MVTGRDVLLSVIQTLFGCEGSKYKHFVAHEPTAAKTLPIAQRTGSDMCSPFVGHRSTITVITEEVKRPEL
jgi:hypothetical protein